MTATRDRFFKAEQRQAAKKSEKENVQSAESEDSFEKLKAELEEPERKSAAEAMGFEDEVPVPQQEEPKRLPRLAIKKKKKRAAEPEPEEQNEV